MSEIHIGELKSNLLTELDASDTEKIVGGTYYHGYYGGKISFDFKKFDLKGLLDKIFDGNFKNFKKGKSKGYIYSYVYKNGKVDEYKYKW